MWIERELSNKIIELSQLFPALILTGARQAGKTSLLQKLFPNYSYVSLDSRILAEQAEESPESFFKDHPQPLLIDEVQYAPELLRHLKIEIDRNRQKKGRFIMTGSQKFTLMKEVSESLAGRCVILSLPGLTVREIGLSGLKTDDIASHAKLLIRGTFPELWADRAIPEREFFQSYLATYLERDLRQVLNVGSLRDFERFLRACAARSSQLLNKSELARDVGISQPTVNEWISALEASNQVTLLEPFFENVGKRLFKSPKLYFNDTGMLCFLLGLSGESLINSTLIGKVWENFVHSEISKWLSNYRPEWSLWFYRDQQNREADFIIQGPNDKIRIFDAKWSEMPGKKSFLPLFKIAEIFDRTGRFKETDVVLISRISGTRKIGKGRFHVSAFDIAGYLK